jgi:hypothetical protein
MYAYTSVPIESLCGVIEIKITLIERVREAGFEPANR